MKLPEPLPQYDVQNERELRRIVADALAGVTDAQATQSPRTKASPTAYLKNNAVFNVKDYGAKGDNATLDQVAVQAAADAMLQSGVGDPVSGGCLYFPPGKYKITDTINLNAGMLVKGESKGSTQIRFSHATKDLFKTSTNPQSDWIGFRDIDLNADDLVGTGAAIRLASFVRLPYLENVEISAFKFGVVLASSVQGVFSNVRINGRTGPTAGSIGIDLQGPNGFVGVGCYLNNYDIAFQNDGGAIMLVNPSFEKNNTGWKNLSGQITCIMPWTSETAGNTNVLDFDLFDGALLVGYGSGTWKIQYNNSTTRRRTIVIPAKNDRPAYTTNTVGGPAGIKLGGLLIREDNLATYDGSFDNGGAVSTTVTTSPFNVRGDTTYQEADASGGNIQLTLPEIKADSSSLDLALHCLVGHEVALKRIDASVNRVSYTPAGSDTVDGSAATTPIGPIGVLGVNAVVELRAIALTKWRLVSSHNHP